MFSYLYIFPQVQFKGTVPQNISPLKSGHIGFIGLRNGSGLYRKPLKT